MKLVSLILLAGFIVSCSPYIKIKRGDWEELKKTSPNELVSGLYLIQYEFPSYLEPKTEKTLGLYSKHRFQYLYLRDSLFQKSRYYAHPVPVDSVKKEMDLNTPEGIRSSSLFGRFYIKSDSLICISWTLFEISSINLYDYYKIVNPKSLKLSRYKSSQSDENTFYQSTYAELVDSNFVIKSDGLVESWSVEVISDKKTWYSYFITNPLTYIGLLAMLSIIF